MTDSTSDKIDPSETTPPLETSSTESLTYSINSTKQHPPPLDESYSINSATQQQQQLPLDESYPPSLPSTSLRSLDSTLTSTSRISRILPNLPPADRGRAAYQFLISAFIVETVVWGLPSSYGVFLQFYQENGVGMNQDGSDSALLPLVGSFSSGLMYLLGPPTAIILNRNPQWRTKAIRIGCITCVLALLLSSFATKAWHLLLTQGLLYSIGGSLAYYPTFSFLSEWFQERRGFAVGVTFAGTALGGLILPFVLDFLLSKYKTAVTLQVLSIASFLLLATAIPFLHPRIPIGTINPTPRDHHLVSRTKIWKNKRLIVFLLANIAQAIGYFLPMLYLPTFAASLGLSGSEGSGLLAAVNATSVLSRVIIGMMSDRMSPHRIAAATMALSAIAVIVLWGVVSTSLIPLLIFSLVLGAVAGGWTSLYSRVVQDASSNDPALGSTLFGIISFTRGVGSLLTAPISSFLIMHPLKGAAPTTAFGIQGGAYGTLVIASGLALAVAAGMEVALVF